MATRKKKEDLFPAECCGVCKFSHSLEDQLQCWANPPLVHVNDVDIELVTRAANVEPDDPICHLFKPKEHA